MVKELEKLKAFIDKAVVGPSKTHKLECKPFFNGAALYVEQKICISLTPAGLAIKLPEETKNRLLKNKKAVPLKYFPKSPIKQNYVLFPGSLKKGGGVYYKYVNESIEYVLTLPKPKEKSKNS